MSIKEVASTIIRPAIDYDAYLANARAEIANLQPMIGAEITMACQRGAAHLSYLDQIEAAKASMTSAVSHTPGAEFSGSPGNVSLASNLLSALRGKQ